MQPNIETYKKHIGDAEPVGDYVNDNVMVTTAMTVSKDPKRARELACLPGASYLVSLVYRYHDSFPKLEGMPRWPDLFPDPQADQMDMLIEGGMALCGEPEEVIKQVANYSTIWLRPARLRGAEQPAPRGGARVDRTLR